MELDQHRPGRVAGECRGQPLSDECLSRSGRTIEDHLLGLLEQVLDVIQEGSVEQQFLCGLDKGINKVGRRSLRLRVTVKQPVEELALSPCIAGEEGFCELAQGVIRLDLTLAS